MIKAIETRYKGYRFRSRLEARWAVFFDALGERWEYEVEGYSLGKYGLYLPDFWLPRLGMHVEIKPSGYSTDRELTALMRAFRDGVGPIVLCCGLPNPNWSNVLYCFDTTDSSGGTYENDCGWGWCMHCNALTVSVTDDDTRLLRGCRDLYGDVAMRERLSISDCNANRSHLVGPIIKASEAAKGARFEHGDSTQHFGRAIP